MRTVNFFKRWDDVYKCIKVIDSCVTIEHFLVAHNMIHNFGKKYKFDSIWSALDKKVSQAEFKKMDETFKQKLTEWAKGY